MTQPLPDGNGCVLIVQIKEIMKSKGKDIKGIAITGLLDNKHKETFLKAGFEEYLCRPFEPDTLIKVVAGMANKDCS